jgi:uncharacterized RDD family membrane protein YckC
MTKNPSISETPKFSYANFWMRAAAFVVDSFILGILLTLLRLVLVSTLKLDLSWENFLSDDQELIFTPFFTYGFILYIVGQLIAFWLYYAFFESRLGATPGKLVFRFRVTTPDGRLISFAKASGHAFARILAFLPFLTGYLMAAFTDKTQALHDLMAGCVVIPKKEVITEEIAPQIEVTELV